MKKLFTSVVIMVSLTFTSLSAQNLLLNSGFELGNDPVENWRPLNWPQKQEVGNAIWVGLVTPTATEEVVAVEGSNCFRMQGHTPGAWGDISQEIVSPGEGNYKLTLAANFALGTQGKLHIELINKPEDGTEGPWAYFLKDSITVQAGQWQNFTFNINYIDSATGPKLKLRFLLIVNDNAIDSKVFLDNIQFGEASTISVESYKLADKFEIYPNPVYDILNLKGKFSSGTKVAIMDMTGKEVVGKTLLSSSSINVSQLHKGIYFISVSTPEKIFVQKFVKQ